MKRISFILLLCVAFSYAHAETIVLRTGAHVKGSIVFQNEEVVIIRDAEGARFQYPRADVDQILADDVAGETAPQEIAVQEEEIKTTKKASIVLELGGGPTYMPNANIGGAFSVDLIVGSHHIGDRHILIGGGIGYHGIFMVNTVAQSAEKVLNKFNFIPIQVALRMPFMEAKHAPVFGASIGYGIAMSKNYLGGIYAGVDFGYRYQVNPRTAITVSVCMQFQQAKVELSETVEGHEFINKTGCNFLTPGCKFALYF